MISIGKGLSLVVTGTGRCGTKFTCRVLEGLGLNAGHQLVFRPGGGGPGSPEVDPNLVELCTFGDMRERVWRYRFSEWGPQTETSWLAAPYLGIPELTEMPIVHLVRHPKKVIDSLVKVQLFTRRDRYGLYYDFAYAWVPEMRDLESEKEKAALFYLEWNLMIEAGNPTLFWRVEDGPSGMLDALGIEHQKDSLFSQTDYNRRGGPFVDTQLSDLNLGLRSDIMQMTERYGYTWDDH